VDQGNLASEGDALAVPSRNGLTPVRTALLLLGAVLGGVVLSLILGSSPAHAADGPDHAPIDPITSTVTTTITDAGSIAHQAIPGAQRAVHAAGGTLVTAVPATHPLVAPVATGVDTALTAVNQVVVPLVDGVLTLAPRTVAFLADRARAPVISTPLLIASPAAHAVGSVLTATGDTGTDGPLPNPVLTSGASAPTAALGTLVLTMLALALLGARKRLRDDALPASPVFETDTSPA
jgi:hypothetical protein